MLDCATKSPEPLQPQSEEGASEVKEEGDETKVKESMLPVINVDDHNRTMVLQVGRVDMRLISPDRKQVLLHKFNRDVSTCVPVRKLTIITDWLCDKPPFAGHSERHSLRFYLSRRQATQHLYRVYLQVRVGFCCK